MLHAQPLKMAHIGERIAGIIYVRNMVKVMQDASLVHLTCFAHLLELVVKEELLSQRDITDITDNCKSNIVSPEFRTVSAYVPQHKLKQDIPR